MVLAWVAGSKLWGPDFGGSKWVTSYIYRKAQVRLGFVFFVAWSGSVAILECNCVLSSCPDHG